MTSSLTNALFRKFARQVPLLLGLTVLVSPYLVHAADATLRTDPQSHAAANATTYGAGKDGTLRGIADRFPEQQWLWPRVWQGKSRGEPDRIYPVNITEPAYENDRPVLTLSRSAPPELATIRLSPQIRRRPLPSPIPAIPLQQISSHLSKNPLVSQDVFDAAPYVLAERDGRTLASQGDEVFARGAWTAGVATYDVVRKGHELTDPDTGSPLGLEAVLVSTATITRSNADQALLTLGESLQEVRMGDRLIPHRDIALASSYLPVPPPFAVDAAIVGIGSGNTIGGLHDTLILNAGQNDGIAIGHLLVVQEPGAEIEDEQSEAEPWQRVKQVLGIDDSHKLVFPGEKVASVLIYRVFEDASLGLVLESSNALRLDDRVVAP